MRNILTHPSAKNGGLVQARTLLLHNWCSRARENTIFMMKEALEGALRGHHRTMHPSVILDIMATGKMLRLITGNNYVSSAWIDGESIFASMVHIMRLDRDGGFVTMLLTYAGGLAGGSADAA
eukprot:6946239-Heterocapsa_arctica.AAC.1